MGTLYGIGVGPGDPELITVKAYRILQESPIIAYPKKLKGSRSYALDIVEAYVDTTQKTMLGLVFPMTKDPDILAREWEKIGGILIEHLRSGSDVAFVTEGDPLLYSTFIHMSRVVQERERNIQALAVPGISSVNAAAARLGIPLAEGDEVVAIVPATSDMTRMQDLLDRHDCVVFLKVAKVLDTIIDLLGEMNLLDKALVITKATADNEHIWRDVRELRHAELNYLTIMVVKK
jgi:precorrin-2/cobalt-factor-2 C20-methyltransferase